MQGDMQRSAVRATFPAGSSALPWRPQFNRGRANSARSEPSLGAIVEHGLRSPPQPLAGRTRVVMEPRLGHDFSRVRVHAGERAAQSAAALGAAAYTVGSDVVMGARR